MVKIKTGDHKTELEADWRDIKERRERLAEEGKVDYRRLSFSVT